ncbi:MAG: hypothetical protein HY775_11985 [Acidobacteria bacterium]|nr:hypothetical protein [Acidobacteriota bacterium]
MARAMATSFVVCLRNEGAEDLDVRKLYAVVPDEDATSTGFLRVIDESGEDYVYPAELFAFVEVPEGAARELRSSRARQ